MKLAKSVEQWAKGVSRHDKLTSGSRMADIPRPEVNVAQVARRSPLRPIPVPQLQRFVAENPDLNSRAKVSTRDPERAVSEQLLSVSKRTGLSGSYGSADSEAALDFLNKDICTLVELMGRELDYEFLNVKLEAVHQTTCPKWHADHVGVRCLCTYIGQGTWWIENKHVKRSWQWHEGALFPVVDQVDDRLARQAGSGDLLLLKGHQWRGNTGLGAVHRSPDVPDDDVRLLLTIDDNLPSQAEKAELEDGCGCGHTHGDDDDQQ